MNIFVLAVTTAVKSGASDGISDLAKRRGDRLFPEPGKIQVMHVVLHRSLRPESIGMIFKLHGTIEVKLLSKGWMIVKLFDD